MAAEGKKESMDEKRALKATIMGRERERDSCGWKGQQSKQREIRD